MSPQHILRLQRIIGNQAVQRMTGGNQAVQRVNGGTKTRPGNAAPALPAGNRIPLLADFEQQVLGLAAPVFARRGSDPAAPAANGTADDRRKAILKEIIDAYRVYEAARTISNMIKLHDFIDHWLKMMWDERRIIELGLRQDSIKALMESIKATILERVSKEMERNGTDAKESIEVVLNSSGEPAKPTAETKFFEKVGVPINFYAKFSSDQVKLFRKLYNALKKSDLKKASILLIGLETQQIVGFPMVKGLFLTYFAKNAHLDHLRSPTYRSTPKMKEFAYTNPLSPEYTPQQMEEEAYAGDHSHRREEFEHNLNGKAMSQNLTNAELRAINDYTSGQYKAMNDRLRGHNFSVSQNEDREVLNNKLRAQHSVVVSGLNKLPKYSGIAYRMINAFADFDTTVKPGGIFTDLAFLSASMTMQGAEIGGTSGGTAKPGALETYVIIHTKDAVNVTILGRPAETEVLFRPGTRFRVNAIWRHVGGKIPKGAPTEAQMILLRNGEEKTVDKGSLGTFTGKVRVVEMTEIQA